MNIHEEHALGIRDVHAIRRANTLRPEVRDFTTRGGVSARGCEEPESARAEAEAGPRFKRQGLVRRRTHLAGDFSVSQSLANYIGDCNFKTLTVAQILPVIVAKRLLIQVPEHVKRLHANICSSDTTLQQTPEVFQALGMDSASCVGLSVIDELMPVKLTKPTIGSVFVCVQAGAGCDIFTYRCLHGEFGCIRKNVCADPGGLLTTASLQQSHHDCLAEVRGLFHNAVTLSGVHVPGKSANESLIHLDFAAELTTGTVLHGKPDTMQHEPCGFLGDANGPVNLPRTDSVLTVRNHPHRSEPLVETNRRILKDGSDLDAELRFRMASLALPHTARFHERNGFRSASWAHNTVGPSPRNEIVNAVIRIGEILNRLLESLGFLFHKPILAGFE